MNKTGIKEFNISPQKKNGPSDLVICAFYLIMQLRLKQTPWLGCGNALWKNYALWKKISKCVKFGTKSTHFEKKFSKCVKFGTNLTHFEKFFQSALRVYINITFDVNLLRTLKKKYRRSKTSGTLFSFNRWGI